jgi:hypothetical protein
MNLRRGNVHKLRALTGKVVLLLLGEEASNTTTDAELENAAHGESDAV